MKKLIVAAAALGLSAITMSSLAASATDNVTVTINLTPVCLITTPGGLTFNYTSFGGAATGAGGAFTVQCTNTLPYKVGFDATATPATTKAVAASASSLDLAYSLGLSGTTTGTGDGTAKALSVTGTMAASQSGTCAVGAGCSSSTEVHAIYVVY
jgi:spore coat protein U-like protein